MSNDVQAKQMSANIMQLVFLYI